MSRLQRCLCDLCFFLAVCAFACAAQQGTIALSAGGTALTDSDMHNYASFMARKAHPENFTRDFALAEATPAVTYPTVQEWIAARIMPPDQFAVGLISVLGGCLVLFYCGWYVLGIELFGSRRLACLLALGMGVTIYVGWGTFWGITGAGPTPRTLYTALVPWLLLAAWQSRMQPRLQLLLMFIVGCSVVVHTINAIAIGCAFMLGILLVKPKDIRLPQFLLHVVSCFLVFFIPIVAFIYNFMPIQGQNYSAADVAVLNKIFTIRYADNFNSDTFRTFIFEYFVKVPILSFGLLSIIVNIKYGSQKIKDISKLLIIWTAGIFILVELLTGIELFFIEKYNLLPKTYEINRAFRFLPCFALLSIFCSIPLLWKKILPFWKHLLFFILFGIGVFAYTQEPVYLSAMYTLDKHSKIYAAYLTPLEQKKAVDLSHFEALTELNKRTSLHDLIFSPSGDLAVRHIALRSLFFSYKDGLIPYHNKNTKQAMEWLNNLEQCATYPQALQLWMKSPAEWLFLDRLDFLSEAEKIGTLIWRNKTHAIFRKHAKED